MGQRRKKRKADPRSQLATYTGDLAKPIFVPVVAVGMLGGLQSIGGGTGKRVRLTQAKKLSLLFEWYGIDPESEKSWCHLAIRLALAHVPGMHLNFGSTKKRRPKSWKAGLGEVLLHDVEAVIAAKPKTQKKMGFEEAIDLLRKDKTKEWHRFSRQNLLTRERAARAEGRRQQREMLDMLADPSSLPNGYDHSA